MIGTLDVIPKSIAPAALAYLILCYGLGDRFAERLALNVHIPACIEGETAKAARADYGADLQKEIARELFEEVFKSVPGMKDLPGMQTIEKLSSQKTRGSNTSILAAKCVCLADAART
ncbi:MAG: hypothetical protein KJ587_11840, partial [Alphaproteobacteria bacterium]|nr:hypothetical protein [Alphaproteobacteria bacterium]